MDLASLRKIAREQKEHHLARLRENYQYARQLGFNSIEAQILSSKSKQLIDELAKQLKKENNSDEGHT